MTAAKNNSFSDRALTGGEGGRIAPAEDLFAPDASSPAPKPAQKSASKADDKPHHLGHRDRLRTRFLEGGESALADYELVEMLLFLGIPRKDTKPLAKELIRAFHSFAGVMAADYEALAAVKGMTKSAAVTMKLVEAAAHRMMKKTLIGQPVLSSWSRLVEYLHATMAQEKKEHFRILFLDRKNNLIADEIQQTGTVDQTPVYPREILKRALHHAATAVVLVHNHPSGDPTPSQADIEMTKQIIVAANALDITVHDHLIVSRKGVTSMKSEGLIDA